VKNAELKAGKAKSIPKFIVVFVRKKISSHTWKSVATFLTSTMLR